jgi:phospholipid transport system substrate-binding protein
MAQRSIPAILVAALLTAPAAAHAQASDPAASVIDRFDQSLLSTMKDAKRLGAQGRYQRLQPVIAQTFDLPVMTRFAVGPTWTSLSPADQQALVRAFTRFTTATYAHNFNGYSGERFTISPQVQTRGPDKLVSTQLTSSGSAPTSLIYRMRQSPGDGWKVIDVYYNGTVSSLTGQRSEFAGTLRSGGAQALVRKLDSRSNELLSGS